MWTSPRVRLLAAAATALLATSAWPSAAAADDAAAPRVNGWYPCAFSTETDEARYGTDYDGMTVFECAKVEVPLCYDGVCESDYQFDFFVKRRLAQKADAAKKAVILIQGGPGDSSINMEDTMTSLSELLGDTVDFYTFDHRGTGRSEFLECDAAQALTKGSPDGVSISTDELQTCLKDLNFQYDGQAAAFSTTSAAMDVRTMITTFMAEQDVYVYGYSYGTYVTQRILQLDVPQVKGYIFDGVDALSRDGDAVQTANSHWNQAIQAPGRRLLEFCFDDPQCPLKFKSRDTVVDEALALLAALDKHKATNECAKIIASGVETETTTPSEGLRAWMNGKAGDYSERNSALAVLGHAQHCTKNDVAALHKIFGSAEDEGDDVDDVDDVEQVADDEQGGEGDDYNDDVDGVAKKKKRTYKFFQGPMKAKAPAHPGRLHHLRTDNVPDPLDTSNPLLYTLIVSSERWAQPAPTRAERRKFFEEGVFSMDDSAQAVEYCVYTGSTEPACQELKDELPEGNTTFFYKRDKYYDAPIVLPDHASALVINGGLDFATPREFGELLYENLKDSGKGAMMVSFDYGTHCGGEAVDGAINTPCRDGIVAAFVQHDGAVDKVDTNCMEKLPQAAFGPSN